MNNEKAINLEECIELFLNKEITANQIEEKINKNLIIFNSSSIEYGKLTRELNKLYSSITNEPVMLPYSIGSKQAFVALCKAIESKKNIEEFLPSQKYEDGRLY